MCLMRVSVCILSVTTTSSAATATMIPHIFIDVILRNTILIHVHWFLIIVIITDIILISVIILIVIFIPVLTSNLWLSLICTRQYFSTHWRSDLWLKGSDWLSRRLALVILSIL